jgi:hypothetical protein
MSSPTPAASGRTTPAFEDPTALPLATASTTMPATAGTGVIRPRRTGSAITVTSVILRGDPEGFLK